MQLPQVIEVRGIRVLTTKQLAELYGTDTERIKLTPVYNFINDRLVDESAVLRSLS